MATETRQQSGKIYKYALIGCGVAGSILLLKLLETVSPDDICVIDPNFDGGDLGRRWGEVTANSSWGNFVEFVGRIQTAASYIARVKDRHPPDTITHVHELSTGIRQALTPHLKNIDASTCFAKSANYDTATATWTIRLNSSGCSGIRRAKTILYSPGCNPKQVNLSKHQISLEIALDPSRLSKQVESGQHILLFGLSHSGTLVLKNLIQLGVQVSAIYRTETPFVFQRDGHYTGIKQSTAQFADDFLTHRDDYPDITLIPSKDAEATIRAYSRCDAIISAIGFSKNTTSMNFTIDGGDPVNVSSYDPITGKIDVNVPNTVAFGFGMAYPSLTPTGDEEAGIESFVKHLNTVIPAILGV